MLDYASMLQETRDKLASRRGWFGKVREEDLFTAVPSAGDELRRVLDNQHFLLKKGTVVWGAFVQANANLYSLDDHWYPAELIASPDPFFDSRPIQLETLSTQIFELKGTVPDEPELRDIAAQITDELTRSFGDPVPDSLVRRCTDGSDVRRYSVIVDRAHLPERVLTERIGPVLFHDRCDHVMLLPASAWGDQMQELWQLAPEVKAQLQADYNQREVDRRARPLLQVSDTAIEALSSFVTDDASCVRVAYDGGHTMQVISNSDIADDDHCIEVAGLTFVVDPQSATQIWGCRIDWATHGEGGGFTFD